MNVGDVVAVGSLLDRVVSAIHDPVEEPMVNLGHSLILGVPPDDIEFLQALALEVLPLEFGPEALAARRSPR